MSKLRISDAPLLPDVDGTEKIPTGGRGDYAISVDQIKDHIFQDVGKEIVGLGNVDNTSDLDKPISTAQQAALNLKADKTYVDTNLDLKADKTNVYTRSETSLALSKKADLVGGVIPSNQLPSYVDDVVEYTTNTLPIIGEIGKIYVTTDTNRTWRWSGNQYVEISNGGVSDSTLKLQTPRKIANVGFDGTQDIDIPHNNLKDRDAVGAHPASAVSDASGKSQQEINDSFAVAREKLEKIITPYDFGAIGDGVYHKLSERYATIEDAQVKYPTAQSLDDSIDLCALEAFFDHCHDNLVNADITLDAYVNRPLYVGMVRKDHLFKTKVFNGHLTLINTQTDAEIPFLMRINAHDTVWTGKLTFAGTEGLVKDRKQLGGLVIGDGGDDGSGGHAQFNYIRAIRFKHFGVLLSNDSIFPRIDNLTAGWIGAISSDFNAQSSSVHVATISARIDIAGEYGQRSELTVSSVPSAYDSELNSSPNMVMFEGDPLPYRITDIDTANNKIKVYPLLDSTKTYSKLSYIYGSGLMWQGNNAGAGNFGHLQFIVCGIGFYGRSLYGGNISYLSTEYCGCGITLNSQYEVAIGYNVENSYFEANTWDYIQQWPNTVSPLVNINMAHALDINKITELYSFRYNNVRLEDKFNASSITLGNRKYEIKDTYSTSVDLSDPQDFINIMNTGGDLLLNYSNKAINDKFRMRVKTLVITQNYAPWATPTAITIKVPSGWYLNGVLNGTLTTNPQKFATVLTVVQDASENYNNQSLYVHGDSLYKTSGTTAERPGNSPTGFVYIDTTLNKPIYKTNSGWMDATGTVV